MLKLSEKTHISHLELDVLRCLCSRKGGKDVSPADISEISFTTGIKDNDEVLRALYTLEGKNLVEPEPRGDFTSNVWQITSIGIRALGLLEPEA